MENWNTTNTKSSASLMSTYVKVDICVLAKQSQLMLGLYFFVDTLRIAVNTVMDFLNFCVEVVCATK